MAPRALRWVATSGGRQRTWRARSSSGRRTSGSSWQSIDGGTSDGTVLFRSLGLDRSLVTLRLDVQGGRSDGGRRYDARARSNARSAATSAGSRLLSRNSWSRQARGGLLVTPAAAFTAPRTADGA